MVRARLLTAALALLLATTGCGGDGGDGDRGGDRAGAAPGRAIVWAVGDAADPGDDDTRLARMIVRSEPDHLLYLGDVYESGTRLEFTEHYDPLYGALASRTSPVVGNHEHPNRETGYEPYWREKLGRRLPPWYAVRVGDWEFVALDSELPHDEGSKQVRWLRKHLRRGPRTTCRVALWHRPRFSAGTGHGDQPDMDPLWEAVRGHVVAVLSGHEHALQRLRPVDGVVQFVSGGGGRELHPLGEDDERLAFGAERFGALRLELGRRSLRHEFVADDGEVLDRGELRCR